MQIEIDIGDDSIEHLSDHAKQELTSATKRYAEELLDEASRLEAAGRGGSGSPEITRTNIKDATLLLRKLPARQHQSWWHTVLKVASAIATFLTGILFNMDNLRDATDQWSLPLFVFVLALAIVTTTADIILGRSK